MEGMASTAMAGVRVLAAGLAAAVAVGATGCCPGFYSQDVGDVAVVRGMGGEVVGSTSEAGFHATSPLNDVLTFSVRNNVITFKDADAEGYSDGSAGGAAVTCNDAGGASFSMDLQVNYSISPDAAEEMYAEYGTQEAYVRNVAVVDVRSVARECAGKCTTMEVLTDRGKLSQAIQAALTERWEGKGIVVEQVSVQGVEYPQSITDRYAEAQAAEVGKAKAKAEQETAKVEAETEVIKAQAKADANAALTESLTPEVLQSQYNEALQTAAKNGCLVVVPEGSQPIVWAGE